MPKAKEDAKSEKPMTTGPNTYNVGFIDAKGTKCYTDIVADTISDAAIRCSRLYGTAFGGEVVSVVLAKRG